MIKCKNLNKNFDDGENKNHILKDISLEVMSGDTLAINGSSGSGKSTLLHILSGLEKTSSGEILIDDTNISYLSENELCKLRLEKIGFIYQFHHLIFPITAIYCSRSISVPSSIIYCTHC